MYERQSSGPARILFLGMSLFCLVHGSTQNASGWDLLSLELEKLGHQIVRASLPADQRDASATVYARVIADTIPAGMDHAIVVAHSARGAFLLSRAE